MVDQNTFYTIALIFGAFWVIVEGLAAYLLYKMYKFLKKQIGRKK